MTAGFWVDERGLVRRTGAACGAGTMCGAWATRLVVVRAAVVVVRGATRGVWAADLVLVVVVLLVDVEVWVLLVVVDDVELYWSTKSSVFQASEPVNTTPTPR